LNSCKEQSIEEVNNKYLNELLKGTRYTACFVETSELYGENDEEVSKDDEYYLKPMYEAHIENEEEEELDDSWTGRYCDVSDVMAEIEAYIDELIKY